MLRQVVPFLCVFGLSGCGTMPFELVDQDSRPMQTSLGVSIPPSQSMGALPPAAGSVVSVIERQRGNALQHDVTLHGAPPNYGENQIVVYAFKRINDSAGQPVEDKLPMSRPTGEEINAEIAERFPQPLTISSNIAHNGAGPFAYAFGRKKGVSCIYAWQWVEKAAGNGMPVTARIRLCRPGMTEEVLVDFVRQLYLNPRTGNSPTYAAPMMVRSPGQPYTDALTAARGGRAASPTAYSYQAHPYGPTYTGGGYAAAGGGYPKVDSAGEGRKVVAEAPIRKRVLVRRIVKRRVVAPQVYSYTPPLPVAIQPAITVAPAPPVSIPTPGGYSAVPMPQ